jgi:hypothetical protein
VVIVHGMGSQQPNETLRGLTDALWTSNAEVIAADAGQIWLKPATYTDLFDLSTITPKPMATEDGREASLEGRRPRRASVRAAQQCRPSFEARA